MHCGVCDENVDSDIVVAFCDHTITVRLVANIFLCIFTFDYTAFHTHICLEAKLYELGG